MATYTAAPIPQEIIKTMLKSNWQNYGGKVPIPEFLEVNSVEEAYQHRANYIAKDYIFIVASQEGEDAKPRDTFRYWDIGFNLTLLIFTAKSRQRLWDIKDEIRRITIWKMHDITNNEYQLVLYKGFNELAFDENKVWRGQIKIRFDSAGVNFLVEEP
jgi:hypothetical protein